MKYIVERYERGVWVPKCSMNFEDIDTFRIIAGVTEYQYRITKDGKDVTDKYRKNRQKSK